MLAGKTQSVLRSCRRLAAASSGLSKTTNRATSVGPLAAAVNSLQRPQERTRWISGGNNEGNCDGNSHSPTNRRYLSTSSRNASTSSSPQRNFEEIDFHPIYVHHVSRVALEHLQNHRSDWLVARGLDRNLKIRNNGTFLLNFPEYGRIWTSYDSEKRQHWLSVYRSKLAVRFLLKDHDDAAQRLQEHQQQWQAPPSVASVQEFHASSIQRIQHAVDEMIRSVESIESKKEPQKV